MVSVLRAEVLRYRILAAPRPLGQIRLKLLKIAGRIKISCRRIHLELASAYPYQETFHVPVLTSARCRRAEPPRAPAPCRHKKSGAGFKLRGLPQSSMHPGHKTQKYALAHRPRIKSPKFRSPLLLHGFRNLPNHVQTNIRAEQGTSRAWRLLALNSTLSKARSARELGAARNVIVAISRSQVITMGDCCLALSRIPR